MANIRQTKAVANQVTMDMQTYMNEFVLKPLAEIKAQQKLSDEKAEAWRAKREQDLDNIKNKVYEALERVERKQDRIEQKQAEIEHKQSIMDTRLTQNTTDTALIKSEIEQVKTQLKSITTIETKTLVKFIWGGVTALAGGVLGLVIQYVYKILTK